MFKLRPFQKEALEALSQPGHVLCVAATGSGKSLIYERSALRPGRKTLLITPLVALARQQHERLQSTGIDVTLGAGVNSQGPPAGNKSGAWIISPEKLQYPSQLERLRDWGPDFLVVDECHCLWDWGEGFRPAFRQIPELIHTLDIRTSLWLTATMPPEARRLLREQLPPPLKELGRFALPAMLELQVARVPLRERVEAFVGWLKQQDTPGIVFVNTREATQRLNRLIAESTQKSVIVYHAGMSSEERLNAEIRIRTHPPDVIVATSAFGMGMDYPHLQWVVLWQAPSSLLSFAQTIGRVARHPTRRARALALWDSDDFRLHEWMLQGSAQRKRQLELTSRYFHATGCRREALKNYFETV